MAVAYEMLSEAPAASETTSASLLLQSRQSYSLPCSRKRKSRKGLSSSTSA